MFLAHWKRGNGNGTDRGLFPVLGLRSEMDRLFDSFLRDPTFAGEMKKSLGAWSPSVDFSETEKEFVVRAEMPGIDAQDLDLSIVDGALVISGEKKGESEKSEKDYHFTESYYG
ncbi:MAG TPA: Hsp20/alpha crystallin family protein, partial [Pirellulales bacterium]|nr:Hsp20/alpha crystallin family protein [Pirellulales bacterium]